MDCSRLTSKEQLSFVNVGKGSIFFKIFPKDDEVYASHLRRNDLKKSFEYRLVEVESHSNVEDGVNVLWDNLG